MKHALLFFSFVSLGAALFAALPPASEKPPVSSPATNSLVQNLGGGNFQIGAVRFSQPEKRVSFPAVVNMSRGLIEYFLVHSTGKIHESVFKTDVSALQVHLAMLLLSSTNAAPPLPVNVLVRWNDGKGEKTLRAEEFVFNAQAKAPMTRGSWSYSGSRTVDGVFLPERDGSMIAVYEDPDALMNNPRPGRDNDEIWQVSTNTTPPVGVPVQIILELDRAHPAKTPASL